MKRHLVIAPHLDDETFGCGGTSQRLWKRATKYFDPATTLYMGKKKMPTEAGHDRKSHRSGSCSEFIQLSHAPATFDQVPKASLSAIVKDSDRIKPTDVYFFKGDVPDHNAMRSLSLLLNHFDIPTLREPSYSKRSQTDFNLAPDSMGFRANVFIDIPPC